MDGDSKLSHWWSQASDWLGEQEWFQQLQEKWEALDAQSRFYLKVALSAGGVLLVLITIFSFIWSVRSLRKELEDKNELLTMIQSGNEELRRLRDANAGASSGEGDATPWNTYLQSQGQTAGVDSSNIIISAEKGSESSEFAKETRYDVELKKVNVKQLVRYAYALENGSRPVKLRHMTVDTGSDLSGYLNAVLSVSTFTVLASSK
jgi:hypothetical protein